MATYEYQAQRSKNTPHPLYPSTWSQLPEHRSRRRLYGRITAALGVVTCALAAATYVNNSANPSGNEFETSKIDPTEIDEVSLADGARFRFRPIVPGENDPDNIAATLNLSNVETIKVKTPSGVVVTDAGNNGDWYGLHVDDLAQTPLFISNPKLLEQLHADRNGLVWVNHQTATPTKDFLQ